MDFTLVLVVVVALFFDFTNGFHDSANAVATIVSTKALSPRLAVLGAALLNFLGAFVSLHVAATLAKGIVIPGVLTLQIVLAGLAGAIMWNLITWRLALPTSSSHALIGGVIGAASMGVGLHVVKWQGIIHKVLIPSLIAPFLGLLGSVLLMVLIIRISRRYAEKSVDRVFRRLQLISGGFVAFTHGTNDAQKTMGIIALALVAAHPTAKFNVPLWVIAASATAMAAGTYAGGWRIINTLGHRIAKLVPAQGFAAETATASTLWVTAMFGFPVSTTHTISGSIVGAGAAVRPSLLNLSVIKNILLAWMFTIPAAALFGASEQLLTRLPGGIGIAVMLSILIGATIFLTRNWTWETRNQVKSRLQLLRPS